MSEQSDDTRRRGVRVLGFAFLALFVLLCIAALIGYFGFSGRPSHYTEQQARIAAMTEQQRSGISESLRNQITYQWSKGPMDAAPEEQIGQRSKLTIPYEDLNVWLAEEGIDLLAEVGITMPGSVKGAMLDATGDGHLRISCDVRSRKVEQVVSLVFDIKVADDGTVTSRLERASAGRLPIPRETAVDLIASRADNGDGLMRNLMSGVPTGPIELPIDLEGGFRDGRLVGLEVRDDAMVITRETVWRSRE